MGSAFDPRGAFRAEAAIDAGIVAIARAFMREIPHVVAGDITRGYLHQSAEAYGCVDGAYNAVIPLVDGKWAAVASHDIRKNARSTFDQNGYAAHTYHRNYGAFGIAVNGLDTPGASPTNFGADPLQLHAIDLMCAVAAAYCTSFGIDATGLSREAVPPASAFRDEPTILTHAEAANRPGNPAQYSAYGPAPIGDVERWDLATLVQAPASVQITADHATIVGNELRGRIHAYKLALAS